MIEDSNLRVLKLCYLLNQLRTQELKLSRARYKVAYYKKIREAIVVHNTVLTTLPDGYFKWKGNFSGLTSKIEGLRLKALKTQNDSLILQKRLRSPIRISLKEVKAALVFINGRNLGLYVGPSNKGFFVSAEKFADMADQYDAAVAMNGFLTA